MTGGAWLGNSGNPQKERNDIEERLKRHKAALLAEAAQGKDASRVRELLSERADPNTADEQDGNRRMSKCVKGHFGRSLPEFVRAEPRSLCYRARIS